MERTPKWEALDKTRHHMLLDNESIEALPPLYSTEGTEDPIVPVKLFCPYSGWTWYLLELDPIEGIAFAYVHGLDDEYGYISIEELAELSKPMASADLPMVERDCYWTPKRVSEVKS